MQLGRKAKISASPEKAVLERVKNPYPQEQYLVRFSCPEFTSLCPVTGQPDFAHPNNHSSTIRVHIISTLAIYR